MRGPLKYGTFQWKGILGMSFCIFSGHYGPFRSFKRPVQPMIMIGQNRFRAKILPKNGTTHRRRIRKILFCTFSALYRFFFVPSVRASQQEIMICWKRFHVDILRKMALPIGQVYQEYFSVHFPGSFGIFIPSALAQQQEIMICWKWFHARRP